MSDKSEAPQPGDYWMTAPVEARVIISNQRHVLVEQEGGGWSDFGVDTPSFWTLEPRAFSEEAVERWNDADERVKEHRRVAAEATAVTLLARDLAGEYHQTDADYRRARELYDLGWRRIDE